MGLGSHNLDFATAVTGLARLLEARPDVRFEIFGSIRLPGDLKRFDERIRLVEPVRDYGRFMERLASLKWTIGMCPLAPTPFNNRKTNTKWVEYSACGMAVVATRGTVYDACCADGCGMLVDGAEEWFGAFDRLLGDKALHRAQVERAQRRLRDDYSRDRLKQQILSVFARARALADQPILTKLSLDEFDGDRAWGWAWRSTETAGVQPREPVQIWSGDVLIGHTPRRHHRPDADAYLGAPAWPKGFSAPIGALNALCRLMGGPESGFEPTIRFREELLSTFAQGPRWQDLAAHRTLRSADATLGWPLHDLWWGNSHLLKARATYQSRGDGQAETRALRVFQPSRQADGRLALAVADEVAIHERQGVCAFGLRNPFMPVLLVGYDGDGHVDFIDLIPFPSLLRGGLHAAEAAAVDDSGGGLAAVRRLNDAYLAEATGWGADQLSPSLADIRVDLETATGAEPIFDHQIREWIALMFRVPVAGANAERRVASDLGDRAFVEYADALFGREAPARPRDGRLRLTLPSCAIPAIGALVSRRLSSGATASRAACVVVDDSLPHRRYVLALPEAPKTVRATLAEGRTSFPVLSPLTDDKAATAADALPAAILIRDLSPLAKEALLYPTPRDAPVILPSSDAAGPARISIFLRACDPAADIGVLLDSVARQKTTAKLEVILIAAGGGAKQRDAYRGLLRETFPTSGHLVEAGSAWGEAAAINETAASASGDAFVFVESRIILHDPRTLETIARLSLLDEVGTVGCMELRRHKADGAPVFGAAGYFPGRVDFSVAPALALQEIDCSALLAGEIYPVAANSARFFALSAQAWRRLGGMSPRYPREGAHIDLALRLANAGLANICTTLVSVFSEADDPPKFMHDLAAASHLDLWRLLPALKSSAVIRPF